MHAVALSTTSILLLALAVNADTSLYLPILGTAAEPLSADVLGVGSDGRTTWRLHNGAPTGTFTSDPSDPSDITETLIEGPSDALYSFQATSGTVSVSLGVSCSIGNGNAACVETIVEFSSTLVQTATEAVSQVPVQGGSTVPATATGSGSSSSTTQGSGSQASAGSSPAGSGAQPTDTPSTGSGKNSAASHSSLGIVGFGLVAGSILSYTL